MLELKLSPEESATLHKILVYYLSELKMEISGTDGFTFREDLKNEEIIVKDIISRLKPVEAHFEEAEKL